MKKNRIFKKLFITYGLTIIISFGILAIALSKLLSSYLIENKKEVLIDQGKRIKEEILLSFYTGRLDAKRLTNDLQILDKYLNAHIWIVDEQGYIVGASGDSVEKFLGQQIDKEHLHNLYNSESVIESGNFGGKLSVASLTIGYPLVFENIFKGGVYIHASLEEIEKTFREIYKIILWAILISGVMAYGILYIQIKRISSPLKEINEAAKIIAGGEFQKRLIINTHDEIEELGKSFNDMAESLERIEENRRNLIANISHDLRSPVTSIRGFIQGILDGTIPEEKQEHYLKVVLDESKRLIKMTNDLLELNNMQQGHIEVKKSKFELHESIRRTLIGFEQQITEKKLDVSLVLLDEAVNVFSSQAFIERIINNLIDNAVKFTPVGGEIIIRTEDEKEKVKIEITNTGVAINEEQLRKVWERFHKGDISRGQYKNGFGLGLAIVREMMSQLDERICLESGSDFVRFSFEISKA